MLVLHATAGCSGKLAPSSVLSVVSTTRLVHPGHRMCDLCCAGVGVQVREEGPRPPPQEERVGLGKLGPLKFKNRPAVSKAAGQ